MSKFPLLTASAFGLTVICAVIMAPRLASAQCTYRMIDVGRPHGYLSGPCNGNTLGYAGAYPNRTVNSNAVKKAPRPPVKKVQ
jgi:hypothetical protein